MDVRYGIRFLFRTTNRDGSVIGDWVRLLIFSDIHGDTRALERLMDLEADYYFAAGDMMTWGRGADRVGPMLARRGENLYLIPGNHESEQQSADLCKTYGLHHLHGGVMEVGGFTVAALGYSSPTPFNTPGEYSESEMWDLLTPFLGLKELILICHCPPFGTELDQVRAGVHAGSKSVKRFIETSQPRYFFCGHIHEAEGVSIDIGATQARNVGKRGYLLEI
jgi:Icc-related predicted phosphoesterase